MSIEQQVARIRNEVSSQTDIVNEIDAQVQGKENYILDLNGIIDGEGTSISNPYIRQIRPYAFYNHANLQNASFENASIIKEHAFQNCSHLHHVEAPNVVLIESQAFNGCEEEFTINMPKLQKIIASDCFSGTSISEIDFPILKELPASAFQDCSYLVSASFSNIEKLPAFCFYSSSLQNIYAPHVTTIGNNAFNNTNIITVDFPLATTLYNGAFSGCRNLEFVNLPLVESLSGDTFYATAINSNSIFPSLKSIQGGDFFSTQLTEITDNNFPVLEDINGYSAFGNINTLTTINSSSIKRINANISSPCIAFNKNLKTVILSNIEEIGAMSFYDCPNLTDVYLLGSNGIVINNSNSFYGCPNVNIWVPDDLYEDYMNDYINTDIDKYIWPATNEMFKDRNVSAGVFPGEVISVSIPCRNVVSTPSISITCSNCSYSNLSIGNTAITFDITVGSEDATCSYTITANSGVYVGSYNYHIYIDDDFSYTVTNRSSTYGFYLNSDGYYESNNKGVHNSYAVCRIYLYNNYNSSAEMPTIYIDCINSGENNYDFGIIGKRGCALALSYSIDSSTNYIKSFKGLSSTSVQTVTYSNFGTSGGYFDIKYRKDGSSSSGNDSLQFKIRFS